MNKNTKLNISQRRALVMAHPDFLYRSSTGYHFRVGSSGRPHTLHGAFESCFKPFRVTMDAELFAVSHLAGDLALRKTVHFFGTAEAAAEYASKNYEYED